MEMQIGVSRQPPTEHVHVHSTTRIDAEQTCSRNTDDDFGHHSSSPYIYIERYIVMNNKIHISEVWPDFIVSI